MPPKAICPGVSYADRAQKQTEGGQKKAEDGQKKADNGQKEVYKRNVETTSRPRFSDMHPKARCSITQTRNSTRATLRSTFSQSSSSQGLISGGFRGIQRRGCLIFFRSLIVEFERTGQEGAGGRIRFAARKVDGG
ncbi:hypothetical protein B0H17DRAFT_1140093 [Mycena rosella]|uniref:Uncharacterized protein n=1 Tax=Mycena rosella TaxID=1033263 RepID=A0AAD7D2M6_MYCRO|nr:hypothetical protein B0H17DRAFT_1140093 [Mycena rosella]